MPRLSESVTVHRPRPEVFTYMDDVAREREWQPSLLEASQDPSGPTRVGTRKRYVSEFLGKRVENTYEAIEVDPGRRVVYRTTRDSTLQATSEVEWADEGTGTRVTLSVDGRPTGVLRFVPRGIIEEASLRQLRDTLRRLKECLESTP
jgi:uncharacterized membrane protein